MGTAKGQYRDFLKPHRSQKVLVKGPEAHLEEGSGGGKELAREGAAPAERGTAAIKRGKSEKKK